MHYIKPSIQIPVVASSIVHHPRAPLPVGPQLHQQQLQHQQQQQHQQQHLAAQTQAHAFQAQMAARLKKKFTGREQAVAGPVSMAAAVAVAQQAAAAVGSVATPVVVVDEVGDDLDCKTALHLNRFKRNHELMDTIFTPKNTSTPYSPPTAYRQVP